MKCAQDTKLVTSVISTPFKMGHQRCANGSDMEKTPKSEKKLKKKKSKSRNTVDKMEG